MEINKKRIVLLLCIFSIQMLLAQTVTDSTFCNPMNLNYRFTISGSGYREAADPIVVTYNGDYYLFASKSGGYWWSNDFKNWTFVTPSGLDIEKYAPAVWVIGNTMYYTSSSSGDIYKTDDPKAGKWTYVSHPHDWNDPWVFVDDDGKVYCYQTNFYESNSTYNAGRKDTFSTKYKIESSLDGTNWTVISDRNNQTKDAPSDYIEFGEAQKVASSRMKPPSFIISFSFSVYHADVYLSLKAVHQAFCVRVCHYQPEQSPTVSFQGLS